MSKNKQTVITGCVKKMATALGNQSVKMASVCWFHQPKVPASMLKKEENKD